jgi:eukaryotic-like serine/threonine-protein kinase
MSDDPSSIELTAGPSGDAGVETTLPGEGSDLASPIDASDRLARGSTVGRYTVLERIGSGGMGVVYSAFDPQLDRRIALKVMHPDRATGMSASSGGKNRLLREAQAMAKLSHPNVITVHDVGTFGDRVFVAMEFIEGCTLRDWLDGEHDWSDVVEAFVRAGRGLAAAHAVGLVHRDFKPDNVLMGTDGRVLVMDFGLARQASVRTTGSIAPEVTFDRPPLPSGREQPEMSMTRTGALMGTPAYMSPEQHKGESIGPTTDQFSFCVALYEGLYGERPFAGTSVTSLAMNVLEGQIKAPPRDSKVPGWLRQVVLRGLRTDPDDRYPSMDALLAELQQDPPRTGRPWVAVGVATAVGGGIVAAYVLTRPKAEEICARGEVVMAEHWNDARSEEVRRALLDAGSPYAEVTWQTVSSRLDAHARQWIDTYANRCRADRALRSGRIDHTQSPALVCLDDQLVEMDATLEGLLDTPAGALERAVGLVQALSPPSRCTKDSALEPIVVRMGLGPQTRARVESLLRGLAEASASQELGRPREAIERAVAMLGAARSLEVAGLEAQIQLLLARAQLDAHEALAAEQSLREAILASASSRRSDLEARAWVAMVDVVALHQEHHDQGRRLALGADAAITRAGDDPRLRADLRMMLGAIEQTRGNYEEALGHFERALGIRIDELPADDLGIAASRIGVGIALEGLSRFPEASEQHAAVLGMRERVLGAQHPQVAEALIRLGASMHGNGNIDLAEASLVRARMLLDPEAKVAIDDLPPPGAAAPAEPTDSVRLPTRRRLSTVLDQLGLVRRAKEEFDQAARLHARAAAMLEDAVGPRHRDLGYPLQNLGLALVDQGRHVDAVVHLQRAIDVWTRTLGDTHPDLGTAHLNLANALRALGRIEGARDHYARALDIWEAALPADHPLLGYALTGLGRAQLTLGEGSAAIDLLERALAIRDHEAEDALNVAETCLALARALWLEARDPARSLELVARARDQAGAYEPRDAASLRRVLEGEEVPRFTDQLVPAGLGVGNLRFGGS